MNAAPALDLLSPVVVTGATGTVGAEVVRRLVEAGARVRVAARDPEGARATLGLGPEADVVPFRFGDPATYAPALRGAERLFFLRPPDAWDTERDLLPVLDAAVEAGVRHVVTLSVLGAEHAPQLPHRIVEQRLEALGLGWTFLRPSFFMQNLTTEHLADIRDRDEVWLPGGTGKAAYIDARDIAAVAVAALTQPGHAGQAYHLTGPEVLDHFQVADILSRVLGRRVSYPNPAVEPYEQAMLRRGLPPQRVAFLLGIYRPIREHLIEFATPDVERVLGRPPITFEQFARDYAARWAKPESALESA